MTCARTRIKFCGITRAEDARAAVDLGVDAIGVILARRSKRCVDLDSARRIRRGLPPFVTAVALFMDDDAAFVAEAVATIAPDALQFHGSEAAPDCVRYGRPYLKAVPMAPGPGAPESAAGRWRSLVDAHPAAAGFVFDGHAAGAPGGSGQRFDWAGVRGFERPLILAGGLTADNVGDAIGSARPFAVDVASGIEAQVGIKDPEKMRRFVAAVRAADEEFGRGGSL